MSLRIALGEDNFLVREGLRRMLETEPDIEVVGAAGDLDELIAVIDSTPPDVVLTDIRMPPLHRDEGIQAAEHCRQRHPDVGVILLSQYVDSGYVRVLLAQGTDRRGYLLKERVAQLDDLLLAVREVAKGGSALDPKVVETLLQVRSNDRASDLARLTPREREVLAAMAQGHTNAVIAKQLFLNIRAVEKHINSIFSKLGLTGDQQAHPRVRAVLLYLSEGTAAGN
jgi:DNA-binding NarL/FixJ family response regulator